MKVKATGSAIEPLENGVYTAVCTQIIDLGMQYSDKFKKTSRRVMLGWEILGETIDIGGEEKPRVVTKEYGFTIGDRSNLKKDLQAWRNKPFTKEELEGFELGNVLNVPCQLQIQKNEKDFSEVTAITTLPKGVTLPDSETARQVIFFDFEDKETWNMFSLISEWVQKKILKAENCESCGFKKYAETEKLFTVVDDPEQLPF